jgi:ApeA N-terminal domain 1
MAQLDVNKPFDLFGQFWKADEEKNRVSGRLYRTEDGIRIQLFEDLRPGPSYVPIHQEGQDPVFQVVDSPDRDMPINLHGRIGQMVGSITAYDCMTVRSQTDLFDSGVGEYILAPRGVIFGAHTAGEKQQYSGVRLRTRDLDEWASVAGFFSSRADDGTRTLSFRMPQFEPITLATGANLTVSQTTRLRGPSVRGGSMEREVWLQVADLQPSTWQEIDRQIVTPLSTLVTLCLGEVNDVSGIQLTVDGENWLTLGSNHIRYTEPRTERLEKLVTLHDLQFDGVAAWLNKVEHLGPLPPVVARFSARQVTAKLETELLEMTTVAEGLHMRLFPGEKRLDDAICEQVKNRVLGSVEGLESRVKDILRGMLTHLHEPGYVSRLKGLAQMVEQTAPEICGKVNKWAEEVSAARNKYAHRTAGFLDEASIDTLVTVLESLRWLLRCILLLEAGVAESLLATRLRDVSLGVSCGVM